MLAVGLALRSLLVIGRLRRASPITHRCNCNQAVEMLACGPGALLAAC